MGSARVRAVWRWVALVFVAGVLFVGFRMSPRTERRTSVEPLPVAVALRATHTQSTRAAAPEAVTPSSVEEPSPDSLAPSLRGTSIDGDFDRGADGHVVFGPAMVRLFDYLRSTIGEASEDEVRSFLERLARARLADAEDVDRVLFLYDRYVAMLDEAADRLPSERREGDPEGALALLHAIRVSAFGEEDAARAFGESERIASGLFARARVLSETSLSADERERRLEAIEADMPEAEASALRAMRTTARLRERTSELRQAGADEEAIRELRVASVGVAAADRLEALDAAREAFRARVDAYRRELAALGARSPDGPGDEAIAALRARHFEGAELLRIAALDRMER